MEKYFIERSRNEKYYSGLHTLLTSIGFGLLGAYAYGLLTSSENITRGILFFMIGSLVAIYLLYHFSLKGNIWFGNPPKHRFSEETRFKVGRTVIFLSQILIGVFCSVFNDVLLKGDGLNTLFVLYALLVLVLLSYPRIMITSLTPYNK